MTKEFSKMLALKLINCQQTDNRDIFHAPGGVEITFKDDKAELNFKCWGIIGYWYYDEGTIPLELLLLQRRASQRGRPILAVHRTYVLSKDDSQ